MPDDNNSVNKQSLPSNEGQNISESADQQNNEPAEMQDESVQAETTDEANNSDSVEVTETPTTEAPAEEVATKEQGETPEPVEETRSSEPETTESVDQNVGESESQQEVPSVETAEVADSAADVAETPKNDVPGSRWYVVHTYSGHENRVAQTLKQRIETEHLEKKILDVLVPTQDKIEIKGGRKATVKEKIFPGYILVKMVLDDASWLAVRTTQGVTSFVGMGNKPTPISDKEVATIVKFTQEEAPTYKQVFSMDDTVKIVDGPFAEFIGKVDNIDEERGKVKVLVSIFGRETPVELDFLQVQKI